MPSGDSQGNNNSPNDAGGGVGGIGGIFQMISRLLLFYFVLSYFFGASKTPKVDSTTGKPLPPHQCLFYPRETLVSFNLFIIFKNLIFFTLMSVILNL